MAVPVAGFPLQQGLGAFGDRPPDNGKSGVFIGRCSQEDNACFFKFRFRITEDLGGAAVDREDGPFFAVGDHQAVARRR